jgi:hypothetical protein
LHENTMMICIRAYGIRGGGSIFIAFCPDLAEREGERERERDRQGDREREREREKEIDR